MNDMLQEAIAGEPVMVTLGRALGRVTYPLAYPIQGVILYKRETALLDRERAKDRPRLTLMEKRTLRDRRQKLMQDAEALRPGRNVDWQPDKFLEFDELMDEATILKIALDEDAGTGDSLYDMYNWRKISPDGDPERLVLALWVGLHRFVPTGLANTEEEYRPRLSRQQLGELIHLGNGGDLTLAISNALSAHLIAASEVKEIEVPDPNQPPPALSVKQPAVIQSQPPVEAIPDTGDRRANR